MAVSKSYAAVMSEALGRSRFREKGFGETRGSDRSGRSARRETGTDESRSRQAHQPVHEDDRRRQQTLLYTYPLRERKVRTL